MRPPLAYTTVQTVLNILERKGKLHRELEGRAYVYSAKVSEEKAFGQSLRRLIDRMFGGSSEELVMSLLKSRQIDAKRLAKLTEQFSKEKGGGGMSGFESMLVSYVLNSLWQAPLVFAAAWIAARG